MGPADALPCVQVVRFVDSLTVLQSICQRRSRGRYRCPIVKGFPATAGNFGKPSTCSKESAGVSRLAMCAEAREGRLYIFMPPTEEPDDYLDLVAAVEATAAEWRCQLFWKGMEPPSDLV